jgi:hypothetical protein
MVREENGNRFSGFAYDDLFTLGRTVNKGRQVWLRFGYRVDNHCSIPPTAKDQTRSGMIELYKDAQLISRGLPLPRPNSFRMLRGLGT